MGLNHTDNFECGLRESKFGNYEDLETHLKTCEIYRCRRCYYKDTRITNIKNHAENRHRGVQATLVDHMKISRNNSSAVSS